MAVELHSPRLTFSRDGRALAVVEDDSVAIVETHLGTTHRVACAGARAAIAFVDQVWIVHGFEPVLTRCALDGRALAVPVTLPAHDACLIAAAVGAPAALWTSSPPIALIDDGDALHAGPGPDHAELVLALTGRRWVTVSGARVVAPSGLSCELARGTRVCGGAIVHDGAAAIVVGERAGGRELVLVGLSNGRMLARLAVPPAVLMRVAARRGLVAMQVGVRRLAVVDARSGRIQGEVACGIDVEDFALDPDGRHIAVRAGTAVELIELREAYARQSSDRGEQRTASAGCDSVAPPASPPALAHAPTLSAPHTHAPCELRPLAPRAHAVRDLRALAPRSHAPPIDRDAALALLDQEMRTAGLWTLCAIAEAWDSRRIGYGNEGQHPYEHEVAALLGMNRGFATEHLTAAHEHLCAHEAALAAQPDRRGPATPVGALAAEFGLSPIAVDILVVVAAPALRSETARLYGVLANDPGRALVDEALVAQILGARVSRHDVAAELDSRAPLIRLGVIAAAPAATRPFAALAVDPIVIARLRCELPDLGFGLIARGSDRAIEELAVAPNVIDDALAALARVAGPARIALRGRPGSGRRTLFAALAAEAGRALGVLDVTLLPRTESGLAATLRAGLQRAQLAGLAPCVVGLENIALDDQNHRELIVETLRVHPGPLAVVLPATEAVPLDPGHVSIELPILAESERLAVWLRTLGDAGLEVADPAALAARYRIGPGTIHRAVAVTAERTRDRARGTDVTDALEHLIRQMRDGRIGAHASRVERLGTWDGLVLPPDVLDSLLELVARVRHRRTVFETWGMDRAMATSRGLTALFSGPPGTGKTLVAGVIARELGLDLYQVDLSKMMSKWIGETERNLAAVFDAAEDGQVILLFDEADSLFAKRTEVRSSNDRYANLEVNYLLQRLDAFEGIAILTTNASGSIDPAFKRRLSFRLSFPFPDEDTREQLWRAHLPPELPVAGPLALDRLAHKYVLSGGYIRNACLRAAFLAARDAGAVSQDHLERAVALEFAELGKLSTTGALD